MPAPLRKCDFVLVRQFQVRLSNVGHSLYWALTVTRT